MPKQNTITKRLLYEIDQGAPKMAIAGVDEVGRGCLVGPVVICAAILPESAFVNPPVWLNRVDDSKKLTPGLRNDLAIELKNYLKAYSIQWISAQRIDEINIHEATLEGMELAYRNLSPSADFGLFDGKWIPKKLRECGLAIIKGDHHSLSIAAASILAKVARDQWMIKYSETYPGYGFEGNKGYPTADHRTALLQLGMTPEHRKSFGPVKELVKNVAKNVARDMARDLQIPLF